MKKVCKDAADRDSFDVALLAITREMNFDNYDFRCDGIFAAACKSGNVELIQTLIDNRYFMMDESIASAPHIACKRGNIDILKMLFGIKKYQTMSYVVQDLMNVAYKHLRMNVVEVLVQEFGYCGEIDAMARVYGACVGGHLDLLYDLHTNEELNDGLCLACHRGQIKAIAEMIRRGATMCSNCHRDIHLHI
jgi:ankyrin repeat protein